MKKNVIFMGSPDFAVPALQALIDDSGIEVIACFSQPPREANRGKKITKTPIHKLAEANDIEVHTPVKLKNVIPASYFESFKHTQDASFADLIGESRNWTMDSPIKSANDKLIIKGNVTYINLVESMKPDFICVAAYGLILPKSFLDIAPCLNIHPSKLPRWRGAAPIQRTIMAGDTETSCCIMDMDVGLDTGDILIEEDYNIPANYTAGELHDYMASKGGELLLKVIEGYKNITPRKQSEQGVTYAHKIKKSDTELKLDEITADEARNLILGLSPYPAAWVMHNEKRLKILALSSEDEGVSLDCKVGSIYPSLVQPEGKKPMDIKAYLNGLRS